ncbi:hypothetical protein VW35_14240 [Devosia soli]|uniref:Uncharacterized protein n=1 Tax=Devosia soli TaxID=361041 RepID=A0A0F5L6E5_9HYPH|nr:hypothetical protein [Devosia soli]KKB77810.1 hypothetical protein VW35_14240 [Devosia soli]
METAKDNRRSAIVEALSHELQRQADTGAQRIDVEALADAVERALHPMPVEAEGRRPDELNSSNDG